MAKILVITAGNDGVGRTTLALNLVLTLKKLGARVLLVDTEAHLPALGYDTDFFTNPYTLVDVANGISVDWALRDSNGIKYLIGSWNSVKFKEISSEKILEIIDSLSPDYDYVIFDSMPAQEAVNLLSATKEVVFVTKPLLEGIGSLRSVNHVIDEKRAGVVVNMIRGTREELSPAAIEFLTQIPVVGQIPYDSHVLLALSARKPVVEFSPHCPASKKIREFVSRYLKGL